MVEWDIDRILSAGRQAGIDYMGIYDYTYGEIHDFCEIMSRRIEQQERLKMQDLAILSFSHLMVQSKMLTGERADILEDYPFWTDEEKKEIRRQRLINNNAQLEAYLIANSTEGN